MLQLSEQASFKPQFQENFAYERARDSGVGGALNPDFRRTLHDLAECHKPGILIQIQTKASGVRAAKFTNSLPFDGRYAGNLVIVTT